MQAQQQAFEGVELILREIVLSFPVRINPADETHAQAVAVVAFDVRAHFVLRSAALNRAVSLDDVVVTDASKSAFDVHPVDVADAHQCGGASGGTVDRNVFDASNCRQFAYR